MQLIGKLKVNVAKTKNIEEAKEVIEEAGMRLSYDELISVVGGKRPPDKVQGVKEEWIEHDPTPLEINDYTPLVPGVNHGAPGK